MFEQFTTSSEEITPEIAIKAIKWNEDKNIKRLEKLRNYYLGKQSISARQTNSGSNNQITINHAKYIVDTNIGYLLGNPVDYNILVEQFEKPADEILREFKTQTINDLDTEIAKNSAIAGVHYEYIYANEDSEPKSAEIDARNIVLIRNNRMTLDKIGAVIYSPVFDDSGAIKEYNAIIVDNKQITEGKLDKSRGKFTPAETREHFFGEVPVVEYRNNAEFQGDFEQVISAIDAYNLLQSDRVNDKEQLVDAILAFYGMDFTPQQAQDLKAGRIISNIPSNGKIEFLTKSLNEGDTDILRQSLERDIHKISMTPNMSDENFVGNSSGVALRYKLLAFEQNTKNKERYFEKGLLERFRIYNAFLKTKRNTAEIPMIEIDVIFKRNLPTNDLEISQMINNLAGSVDKATLISQLSFVKDAQATIDKAEKEEAERADNGDDISDTKDFTAPTIEEIEADKKRTEGEQ